MPPVMVKSDKNPGGLPIEVFDGFRKAVLANRAQFYKDVPSGPFYGFNRPGAKTLPGSSTTGGGREWRAASRRTTTASRRSRRRTSREDLKRIDVPTLVMHGEDDQIVPIADAALLSVKLLKKGTLKVYPGLGHGMCTINPEVVNKDLLEFIQS